ncbi:ADP-ribosylglycohydrolase family protein [Paludisphaera soli]|uniref:ADP-ribosylglycohydrolase family protein n=1 Tax=Paludisphaera soli TaxID=2712865 RepID=UPI0013ED8468|nr:ADP-ribosylglycohydrolase family protein [Paludisphaera soli]
MAYPADDRLVGILLGTALGDALGLPCEGMSARSIARRFGTVDRFRLLGSLGFVSDDTEQSALVAQSLARHPDDFDACVRDFRRALLGWFCRLPWGVGKATVLSCLRIGLGLRPTGVRSAGNGAAMRAAIVGGFLRDRPDRRRELARALAEVTHRDPRAVDGAVFVAETAALAALGPGDVSRLAILREACHVVEDGTLLAALERAIELATTARTTEDAARACGTSGYVVHTLAFAAFCFARFGDEPMATLTEAIHAGGDTDSIAAILGAWLGALHGPEKLPASLLGRIHDGPFGPSHLRALGECLAARAQGVVEPTPSYSTVHALSRNLALYPVVLAHGLRRLLPF